MPELIGLGGKLRAGKDAVADYLVERRGWVKLGMSDALHEAALVLNPIVALFDNQEYVDYKTATEDLGYVTAKEVYPAYREFLQRLGTEVGRNMFGENVWVDIMADKIEKLHNEGKNVVVTGIRFPNEVDLISRLGVTVWIKRPPLTALDAVVTHASENSVSEKDFQYVINNVGSLDDLYNVVNGLLAKVTDE